MKIETSLSRDLSYIIVNHLELQIERQTVGHPDGWITVERPCRGEIVVSVGRLDIHLVNNQRTGALFAARGPLTD